MSALDELEELSAPSIIDKYGVGLFDVMMPKSHQPISQWHTRRLWKLEWEDRLRAALQHTR